MKLALAIIVGAFSWACIAIFLLTICIGDSFVNALAEALWRLK